MRLLYSFFFIAAFLLVGLPSVSMAENSTPVSWEVFGLKEGMSLSEIKAVGLGDVQDYLHGPDWYYVTSPSQPADAIGIQLCVPDEYGLIKIVILWDMPTNNYGDQVKIKFNDLYKILIKKYGKGKKYDFHRSGGGFKEHWLWELSKEERVLSWGTPKIIKDCPWYVSLDTSANFSDKTGTIRLSYESESFGDYLHQQKAQEAQGF